MGDSSGRVKSPLVRRTVKVLVTAAIVASVYRALAGYQHSLEGRLANVNLAWLASGFVLCVLYRVLNAFGWSLVLRALGARMPALASARIWLVSETLRWLPGSVWGLFSRAAQAREAGVPALAASLSLPLELLLTIVAWGVTAVVGLALSGAANAWAERLPAVWLVASAGALLLTVAVAVALARWRPAAGISKKVRGLQESLRQLRSSPPRASLVILTFVYFTALCVLNGAAFLAVLRAVYETPPGLVAATGVNAAGWLVGFFAFFAPAGLGVREGGMAAMLGPLMPVDAAIIGVLLWRLVQIFVEAACLGACFVPTALSVVRRVATRASVEPG